MKYVIKLNSLETMELFRLNEKGERVFQSNDRQEITKNFRNFCGNNCIVHIHPNCMIVEHFESHSKCIIVNPEEIMNLQKYNGMTAIINALLNTKSFIKYKHDYNANIGTPKRRKRGYSGKVKTVALALAGSLIVSAFPFAITAAFKKWDKEKTKKTEEILEDIIVTTSVQSSYKSDPEPIIRDENLFDEYTEKEEEFMEFVTPEIDEMEPALLQYRNENSSEKLYRLIDQIIKNMKKYNMDYSQEEVMEAMYTVSQMSQEEKFKYMEDFYGITHEQALEVVATLVCEGKGDGQNYNTTFVAATTSVNHTDFQDWINSVSNSRGFNVGNNIYYHTCYVPQFEPYGSTRYNNHLGDTSLVGCDAVLDCIVLFGEYKLIAHDYGEFKAPSLRSTGWQIEDGDNYYHNEEDASMRLTNLTREKTI